MSYYFCRETQLEVGGSKASSVAALQKDLSEIERDLTLRKLLWESMNEWEFLIDKWKSTQFDALVVDAVQNDVTRFVQTVFLLEKGKGFFRSTISIFITLINFGEMCKF